MLPKYRDIIELMKKGSTIEAQEQIMNLREAALELQEENYELKERIQKMESILSARDDWGKEKGRYKLVSPWNGPSQVYALIKAKSENETPHFLCTNCFSNSKKVILNPIKSGSKLYMVCPSCDSKLDTGYTAIGQADYAEDL